MWYFKTGNASRPYSAGGQRVFFETTGRTPGGGVAGIYATSVKAVASGLRSGGPPVYEIEKAEYDELKKKLDNELAVLAAQYSGNASKSGSGDCPACGRNGTK